MDEIQKIKEHWSSRAKDFIKNPDNEMGNTLYDENLRRLEIEALKKYISPGMEILDIGCGNGFSSIDICRNFDVTLDAVDYSPEMINNAEHLLTKYKNKLLGEINFCQFDILAPQDINKKYDTIISERCLINLVTWENQMTAIKNIHHYLKDNGLFLMLEGFKDNLDLINEVRKKYDLNPIQVVWHNIFFEKAKFEAFITQYFKIENIDNYGSTYMLITRSLFHVMSNKFDKGLDYLATLLPNWGDYNYQRLYALRKI